MNSDRFEVGIGCGRDAMLASGRLYKTVDEYRSQDVEFDVGYVGSTMAPLIFMTRPE